MAAVVTLFFAVHVVQRGFAPRTDVFQIETASIKQLKRLQRLRRHARETVILARTSERDNNIDLQRCNGDF